MILFLLLLLFADGISACSCAFHMRERDDSSRSVDAVSRVSPGLFTHGYHRMALSL